MHIPGVSKLNDEEKKLISKNIEALMKKGGKTFGDSMPEVTIIDRFGGETELGGRTKRELAKIILDKALKLRR